MLQELNIANNRVLKGQIDLSLVQVLAEQAEANFIESKNRSAGYPEKSNVYLFRTPFSLENPEQGPGYQFMVKETEEFNTYKVKAIEEVANIVGEEYSVFDKWFLLQNEEPWIDNDFHQHLTSAWTAVCYIKVNAGDAIEFKDDADNIETYYPEAGDLLIFPSSAWHRPVKNAGSGNRISLNMEFGTLINAELTAPQQSRLDVCNGCERLNSLKICGECFCFMPFKVKITSATCPLNKW